MGALALLAAWGSGALAIGSPLELRVSVAEPFIQAGRLETELIVKRLPLPQAPVTASRKLGRVTESLSAALDDTLTALVREATPPRFAFVEGHWVARQHSAWRPDATKTRRDVLNAILNGRSSAPVTLTLTPPNPDVPALYAGGVTQLVASGVSTFYGSPSFRVTNIRVGVGRLDGLLVAPGQTFSFNAALGPTTAAEGYVDGYVILNNTLSLEPGGGICQVSTTVFRAAWNAGLPLVERHNHSYLVHYYDPPGLEATVYAPRMDFKFLNDTANGLYLQWSLDGARATARLDLFGAARDRRVQVNDPVILARTPAPGPRFSADAAIPLGQARLLDGAEPGVRVYVSRAVTYANGKTRNDRVDSNYTPWGAIWRVNPNDPRLAPPKPPAPDPAKTPLASPTKAPPARADPAGPASKGGADSHRPG